MKKNLLFMASLLFILLSSSFCFSEEPHVSISGKFSRTSSSGLPLNDIQIRVTGTKEITIRTDRSGNYIAYNLPAGGNYTITPFKAGFFFSPQTKTYTNLTASKVNENFSVSERTYSISGRIIVGGKPSKGEVVMINTRAVKYFTNDDGEYFIDNLPYEGPYTVTVESNKFVFEPFKIEQLDKDIVYNFEKSIKARGYVTSFGMGIPNVEIAVNNKRYKTDENGFYEISGLMANGSYILAVINTEMNPEPKFVELKKIKQDRDNVNFSLSGSISGKIQIGNKPFVGAEVKIVSNDQSAETKTDKNGNYKINKLGLHRDYVISVFSSGYSFSPNDRTIKKLAGQLESQNFTASIEKYKIYGTVMTGKTPAKDVEVSINGFSKFIKTDSKGVYSFDNLAYGKDYTVSVRSKHIKFIESKKIVKNIREKTEVNFNGLLSISGKVTINGRPLENAKILYDFKSFILTDENGNYEVKDLMPGQVYTIEVSSGNYEFEPSSFTSEQLEECLTDKNFTVVVDPRIKEKQEEITREQAKKKAQEEETLRKEELKQIALQEKLAQEEAKKKAKEEEKLRKEELKQIALQEKLAQEEAKKKAKEEETLRKEELKKIALQEKLVGAEFNNKGFKDKGIDVKTNKEELEIIALQEKLAQEEAKKKAKEEEKLRKEELKQIALQEKLAQEEAKKKAKEEETLRKEEL
ncbi:MAG: carboxypeptidase-like regulatory domain-containing protein, partial [Endomicrobiaceae bacterium]|nr:carboxypeptidase-like regulatory domain-containing protein [Endomicrobiaceae bacterium]